MALLAVNDRVVSNSTPPSVGHKTLTSRHQLAPVCGAVPRIISARNETTTRRRCVEIGRIWRRHAVRRATPPDRTRGGRRPSAGKEAHCPSSLPGSTPARPRPLVTVSVLYSVAVRVLACFVTALADRQTRDNNNINNNRNDNVYGAVIMTKVIARVHPVHLMNVDWVPGACQPSDQASIVTR